MKNGQYEFVQKHYLMNSFSEQEELDLPENQKTVYRSRKEIERTQLAPIYCFVENDKYYTCEYKCINGNEHSFDTFVYDIVKENDKTGMKKLTNYQDVKKLRNHQAKRVQKAFMNNFSLHAFSSNEAELLEETLLSDSLEASKFERKISK